MKEEKGKWMNELNKEKAEEEWINEWNTEE